MKNKGQDKSTWTSTWNQTTPENEIRMWDFYGGRQWISKYVPRFGKTIEAGCGLGRYVFYFSRMGIDIEGVDFSEPAINFLNEWKRNKKFNVNFKVGDVTKLPYNDENLRGYISLGVVEHFVEGPHKPIAEAYRVLEPGGIAIITTPSVSWNVFLRNIKIKSKDIIKKIIRYKFPPREFFQYEYRPKKLKKFVEESGLIVTAYDGADLLYPFTEIGNYKGENITPGSFAYWFANKFENTILSKIGAQSITISVKLAERMYCFLCGEKKATPNSLKRFTIPLCNRCQNKELSNYYMKGVRPRYAAPYIINPPLKKPTKEICEFSAKEYLTDELFEDYGFTRKVSPEMLQIPDINMKLCNENIQPIWRKRVDE